MAEAAYYDDLYRESRRLGAAAAATLTRRYGWLRGDVYAWPAGWIDIVERLCVGIAEALAATSVVDGFTVTQLKEKYGGLKVYCDPHHRAETTATDRRIAELVAAAEMESD